MTKIYKQLDALPQLCNSAFVSAERHSIFLSRPWFENFVQHVVNAETPLFIFVSHSKPESDQDVALLLLWNPSDRHHLAVIRPRKLLALGNYYTSLFAPIYHSESPQSSVSIGELVRTIAADKPAWDVVDVKPLNPDSSAFKAIGEAFQQAGWFTHRYFSFGNWYYRPNGASFADYLATRPSQLRNTLRRKQKKFNQQTKSRLCIITGNDGLAEALAAYQAIYAQSWKQPEPFPEFVPGLIRTCAAKGWLRLGIAWIDEHPVAAQIWIVSHGIASIYKLAYDPDFEQLSPGSLLTAKLMEYVLDQDRVTEVDYLTGDDAYKRDWMTDRRERWGIMAFNSRTPRGLIAAAYHIGGPKIRQLLSKH